MSTIVSPSILSADFGQLDQDIELINNSAADWVHFDVMDGSFVPNISFGFPILKAVAKKSRKVLDVHLMIVNPDNYLEDFAKAGAHILTVHQEACVHLHRTLQSIKALGMKAGVALNPGTPVSSLEEVMDLLDLVLIMSVNPGFGGQKFIDSAVGKVQRMADLRKKHNANFLIEVDGGVNTETGQKLVNAGADALVAGSFVFKAENPTTAIQSLHKLSPSLKV